MANNWEMHLNNLEEKYGNFYAPSFSIEIDRQDLKKLGIEVTGVTVDNIIDGADQFSFQVNNFYDPKTGKLSPIDEGVLAVGKEVRIKMGYGSTLELLLLGLITSVRISFTANGTSEIDVSGYDLSHLMTKGKKSNTWNNMKDSDVVLQLGNRYGLKVVMDDSKITHPQIRQDRESDFDLVMKLVRKNGFEFFIFDRTLYFRAPARDKAPILALQWGVSLISFSPEINIAEQVTDVKVYGWDQKSGKQIIGKASKGEEGKRKGGRSGTEMAGEVYRDKVVEEVRKPVYSQAEADSLARAILSRMSEGLISGSGNCIGLPHLRPGKNIVLSGLGQTFSKSYYVEKTTHVISTSGYTTTFGVKDNSL